MLIIKIHEYYLGMMKKEKICMSRDYPSYNCKIDKVQVKQLPRLSFPIGLGKNR